MKTGNFPLLRGAMQAMRAIPCWHVEHMDSVDDDAIILSQKAMLSKDFLGQ